MTSNFLFAVFPFVAGALLVAGVTVRYLLYRKDAKSVFAEIAQAKEVFAGNRLWQLSLLLLLAGHAIALFMPATLLEWNSSRSRLYLLEGFALLVGIAALTGWLVVLWRSLRRHGGSKLAELSDTVLLALLFVGILSGLMLAVAYRWGSSWGAMILGPYLVSLLRGKTGAGFVLQMPFLVRLHVFSLFAALAVLPATRLGAIPVWALQAFLRGAGRMGSLTGRPIEAWWRKHNPASRLWPEED